MSALRTIALPLDHLVGELSAFPLSSEHAIETPVVELDDSLRGKTGRLWQQAESTVLSRVPGFGMDELIALRDSIWFGTAETAPAARGANSKGGRREPMQTYLRRLAENFLVVRGAVAQPKMTSLLTAFDCESADGVHARRAFRWLSFALPADLLLAALPVHCERVDLLTPAIARTLRDSGYAECHLHLGAALDFDTLWCGTLRLLGSRDFHDRFFCDVGAEFGDGARLAPWLLRAGLARVLLVAYLATRRNEEPLEQFLARLSTTVMKAHGARSLYLLARALRDLREGKLSAELDGGELRELYAGLTGSRQGTNPDSLAHWASADPLAKRLGRREHSAELSYLRTGIHYLESNRVNQSSMFAELFWQTVRVRGGLYRHVVQRPMTPGLQWFVRFYGRMARARGPMPDSVKLLSAAKIGGMGQGLRSLEVRTSPERNVGRALKQVRELADTIQHVFDQPSQQLAPVEFGLVYHFIKDRGRSGAHWAGSHGDPSRPRAPDQNTLNRSGMRFGTFFQQQTKNARSLVWLFHHFPDSVRLIRGIDVCTDELGVPNWVLAPLVRFVRSAALRAQAIQGIDQRFGATAHAGEDFVHLLSGLRGLDEAVDVYEMSEGDRIGHGLAVGIEPTQWARRAGRLAVLVEDRLLDLVWIWGQLSTGAGVSVELGRLEREIRELSARMFGQGFGPYKLHRMLHWLRQDNVLRRVGFPEYRSSVPQDYVLLHRYLTDAEVYRSGRQTVWIDPLVDEPLIVWAQEQVRRKLIARGICIEVNPTSNLLIGDYGDLVSHPLWRLRPPRREQNVSELSLCIGSDDPVIFASNLREEYQWLHDAMRTAGVSDEEARRWLSRTRECGMETRFTIRADLLRPGEIAQVASPRGEMPSDPLR